MEIQNIWDLPRKIAMSGCGADCVRAEINDLAFIAVKNYGKNWLYNSS
ncbi:MAG: hypothetical protein QW589_01320 [Candidatus Bathyarchaeia archaeon]